MIPPGANPEQSLEGTHTLVAIRQGEWYGYAVRLRSGRWVCSRDGGRLVTLDDTRSAMRFLRHDDPWIQVFREQTDEDGYSERALAAAGD